MAEFVAKVATNLLVKWLFTRVCALFVGRAMLVSVLLRWCLRRIIGLVPPAVGLPSVTIPRRPLWMMAFASFSFHVLPSFAFAFRAFVFAFAFAFSLIWIVVPRPFVIMEVAIWRSRGSSVRVPAIIFPYSRLWIGVVILIHIEIR